MSSDCECCLNIATVRLTHWETNWNLNLFHVCSQIYTNNIIFLEDIGFHWEPALSCYMPRCDIDIPLRLRDYEAEGKLYMNNPIFSFLTGLIYFWTQLLFYFDLKRKQTTFVSSGYVQVMLSKEIYMYYLHLQLLWVCKMFGLVFVVSYDMSF